MKPQDRSLPTEEARDLLQLVREISDSELAPHAATYEEKEQVLPPPLSRPSHASADLPAHMHTSI